MNKNETAYGDYLSRQNFSEEEIENLHEGKPEYKKSDTEE
jgi:hypothetical protein